ncbi:hypothetical protein [Piscinibacter sakaiensis]|uniref:hypothetical protein n=1 Tax=Piscinibacter sakaiensis TaxID=1547922 RepID=UPI003AAB0B90
MAVHAAGDAKPAAAADKTMMPASHPDRMTYSDREMYKPWSNEKDVLKNSLKAGQDKAFYKKALNDAGYQITSINVEKPEKVEYEVVKGAHSYEVQIDFDKSGKATKVDIDGNLWRADSTKAAMRGNKLETPPAFVADNERFSDRARMKSWTSEKEQLEKALKPGQDTASYMAQLKKLGYQITSTNEREKDYVEYEVVKGQNSYEVQIDLEAGKGKKVDVTTNMWQSDATEKALAQSSAKMTTK